MSTKSTTRPISKAIADLEVAALAGHAAGQRPGQFFLRHWTALGRVARGGPAVYDALAARLLRLLASGGGGDGDQVDQGQGGRPWWRSPPATRPSCGAGSRGGKKQKAGKGVDGSGGRGKKKNLTQKIGEGFSAEANGRHEPRLTPRWPPLTPSPWPSLRRWPPRRLETEGSEGEGWQDGRPGTAKK